MINLTYSKGLTFDNCPFMKEVAIDAHNIDKLTCEVSTFFLNADNQLYAHTRSYVIQVQKRFVLATI
jgi:hypothetical protein